MEIFTRPIKLAFIGLIKVYQSIVSPYLSPSCRHIPTCSQYCIDSIYEHGLLRGIMLSLKRLVRCRPGGTAGYDPVPKKNHE